MARRPRRTPIEKLEDELVAVQDSITQSEDSLITLKNREKQINELLEIENAKEVMELLKGNNMTIDDLKGMLSPEGQLEQGA